MTDRYAHNLKDMKEEDWKKILSPEEYNVLREAGTEPPFSGEYVDLDEEGTYVCRACGKHLFSSKDKAASGHGWPSFGKAIANKDVILRPDNSQGMKRTEVLCEQCGSHLGHVFPDGPNDSPRYCINSLSLDFHEE